MAENDEITITKKISKMGENSIIVIPKALKNRLLPGNLVEVRLRVLEKSETDEHGETERKNFAKRTSDPKLGSIISALVEKGHSFENISKVLVKNGYDENSVKDSIEEFRNQ
ncbi:MAG: hypothetical protein ACLFTR_05015 [Candidatus Woesearchaeota archaeon]